MFVSPFCYVDINEPIPNLNLFQLSYVCHALWWHTFALQVLFPIMNPEQALARRGGDLQDFRMLLTDNPFSWAD